MSDELTSDHVMQKKQYSKIRFIRQWHTALWQAEWR